MARQKAVSRYKICIVTEAAGLTRRMRALGASGRWAAWDARGAQAGRAGGARRLGARGAGRRRAAYAHLGVLTRPVGCVLGALSLL